MEITSCGGCGSRSLSQVLTLRRTPVADRFSDTKASAQYLPRYPLDLLKCESCTLVQLSYHVPDHELYGDDYAFFSGTSPALVKHFAQYAADLKADYPDEIRRGVIEIASNDGTLLEHFGEFPHLGVDPAEPPTRAASAKGLYVYNEAFSAPFAKGMTRHSPAGGLVIANNVLAHVRDPHDIVEGIATLIGDTGVFVGEFQYLPDLLLGNNFDLVYHEHRYFYSLDSLASIFQQHGLSIFRARHIPTQGGSVRIHARAGERGLRHGGKLLLAAESSLPESLEALQGKVDHLIEAINLLLSHRDYSRTLVGYGASAKSCTMLHQLNYLPEYIVDTSPYKVGKFAPGTGIPIVADYDPAIRPGAYQGNLDELVLIGNYAGSILRREAAAISQGNRFIFPLPYPVVV